MSDPNYTPTTWVDDGPPALSAANLNHAETGLENAHARITAKKIPTVKTLAEFAALSPLDGDEVYLVIDATALTKVHLRYNLASASAYKWEVVGESPWMYVKVDTDEVTATTGTWVNLTTVGPRIFVPRPGEYEALGGCSSYHTANNGQMYAGVGVNDYAGPGDPAPSMLGHPTGGTTIGGSCSLAKEVTCASGDDVRMKFFNGTTGTAHFLKRWLAIRMKRCS